VNLYHWDTWHKAHMRTHRESYRRYPWWYGPAMALLLVMWLVVCWVEAGVA
jgi:hypothetical protein